MIELIASLSISHLVFIIASKRKLGSGSIFVIMYLIKMDAFIGNIPLVAGKCDEPMNIYICIHDFMYFF